MEKKVFTSIPVSIAVDLVQLQLMTIADDLRVYAESAEAPSFSQLEEAYKRLISLATLLQDVEKDESK
jgi:hypothetical protein